MILLVTWYPTYLPEALAENGRLAKVPQVVEAFNTIMAAERGEVVCEVTTAKVRRPASSPY